MTSPCMEGLGGRTWALSFPHGWGLTLGPQLPKLLPQLWGWTKQQQLPSTWQGIMVMMFTKESSCTAQYFDFAVFGIFIHTIDMKANLQ